MIYDAKTIANWFIRRAADDGRSLSIMTLLKLIYISHGWNLEIWKEPLIFNRIEAWQYGPVIPDVYNAFRPQGVNVSNPVVVDDGGIEQQSAALLGQIYDIYGGMSAYQLSNITHVKGGPWDLATKMGGNYAPILDELIQSHYEKKRLVSEKLANA